MKKSTFSSKKEMRDRRTLIVLRGNRCEMCGWSGVYEMRTINVRRGNIITWAFAPVALGLDVHHIVPRSKGGFDTDKNLMVVCKRCHGELDAGRMKPGRYGAGPFRIQIKKTKQEKLDEIA